MIKTIHINRFDGGMSDFDRDLPVGQSYYLENVVVGEKPSIKQNANTTGEGDTNTRNVQVLLDLSGTFYGLGWDDATNKDVSIYQGTTLKQTLTGADLTTGGKPFFQYYQGYIYFDGGTNNTVYKYLVTSDSWVALPTALSGPMYDGCVWQGNGYGHYGQDVYKINFTTGLTTSMITIPSDQTIVDLIPYGNFIAIICTSTTQASRCYFWDGVTTTTFAEIVDIGWGDVTGADILDGTLYALIGFPNTKGFRLKRYTGSAFQTAATYLAKKARADVSGYTSISPSSTLKAYTGYLYFLALGIREGETVYEQFLFRYGRKDETKPYSLSIYKNLDYQSSLTPLTLSTENNDFLIMENTKYPNLIDKYIYTTICDNTSKTSTKLIYTNISSSSPVFSDTSQKGVIETGIFTCGDSSVTKQLKGVSVHFNPLPSSSSVTLKYKKDEETSWTTIFTDTTANDISHEAVNIESTGANLPQFKEISFRIEFYGNAEITGMKLKYEELSNIV